MYLKYRCYMFRSSTIIRQLALNLAKVIFMFKTFGGIMSLFIMRLCGSMSCNGVGVACCTAAVFMSILM